MFQSGCRWIGLAAWVLKHRRCDTIRHFTREDVRKRLSYVKENKAVYTALVAPSKPKKLLATDQPTDGRTDGQTNHLIESERLKTAHICYVRYS